MSVKCLILIAALAGFACGQSDVPTGLPDNFTLPQEFKDKVDEKEIKMLQNKFAEQFKKKCEDNGGAEAYERAKTALTDLPKCLKTLVDPAVLQQELEKAKPNGNADEVFKKYCQKQPSFKACFNNITEAANPCFTVDEKKNLKTVANVTENLIEFICHKEGDRITLFIAEGGEECLREKMQDLQNCMNSTFGENISLNIQNINADNIPTLSFDEKQCRKLTELQYCVVGALDSCPKPTSANIVESLFKYIRKSTPCKAFEDPDMKTAKPNGVTVSTFSVLMLVVGAVIALFV